MKTTMISSIQRPQFVRPPAAQAKKETTAPDQKSNILYVDDEPINLKIFQMTFKKHYNVFTSESGKEALEILKNERIDLLITDQRMPEMNGTELLEKSLEINADIVRIILTGFSDIKSIEKAVNNCGIYKYMTKPYEQGDMRMTLDKALEMQKLKAEKEKLLALLNEANRDLEMKVEMRTLQLHELNQRLIDGLKYAKTVQQYLLPDQSEFDATFKDSFVYYQPKDYVGGDFYWLGSAGEQPGSVSLVSVFDCMGHGVAGALLSMTGESYLSQIIYDKKLYQPDEVLKALHQLLLHNLNSNTSAANDFQTIDMAFVAIDRNRHTLKFAGAKMDLLYFDTTGNLTIVKGNRKSLGFADTQAPPEFTCHSIPLDNITEVFLLTDGIKDQMRSDNKKFGLKQLTELLRNTHHLKCVEQKEAIVSTLKAWTEGGIQMDDITIMGLKI